MLRVLIKKVTYCILLPIYIVLARLFFIAFDMFLFRFTERIPVPVQLPRNGLLCF